MSQTRFNNFIYSELEQDYESKKVCAASTLGLVSFSRIYIYIYIYIFFIIGCIQRVLFFSLISVFIIFLNISLAINLMRR